MFPVKKKTAVPYIMGGSHNAFSAKNIKICNASNSHNNYKKLSKIKYTSLVYHDFADCVVQNNLPKVNDFACYN